MEQTIEAIADQWNLDNIAALEGCVADSCDPDFLRASNF